MDKCFRSILDQSYKNFEVILVNDGSTDLSKNICEKYETLDSRVKLINIIHSGSFQARKAGIDLAIGEYITFLDADDWIEQGAFEFAGTKLNKEPDIDLMTYAYISSDVVEKNNYDEGIYYRDEIENTIINTMMFDSSIGKRRLNPSLCTKFIKSEILKAIHKDVSTIITLGDDAIVTYSAVCMSKKIAIYNNPFYHYESNKNSSTHVFPLESMQYISNFQNTIMEKMKEYRYLEKMQEQIDNYTRTLLSMFIKDWFCFELNAIPFLLSLDALRDCSKVLVYGAGVVGKSFVKQITLSKVFILSGWIDKKYQVMSEYMGIKIDSPENIKDFEFDRIIIAIENEEIAKQIELELIQKYKVADNKIYWTKPIRSY